MNKLDRFLAYAESNRATVCAMAGLLTLAVAWADWELSDISVGFLYLFPILLSAAALRGPQIVTLAILCGYLREAGDPLQGVGVAGLPLIESFNPVHWVVGSFGRLVVTSSGFAMTGFFIAELNQRRRRLGEHLGQLKTQVLLRRDAERQLEILIETSPLAILTLDHLGYIELANESARGLLGLGEDQVRGEPVEAYLPILQRMLRGHHGGANMRTNVECKGRRRDGEVFLAHVWLSTYRTQAGTGLAAVIWDASENLRDREGAGLDSMMATSRVLVGAIAHEIRNLASAAAVAHAALNAGGEMTQNAASQPGYQALGALIRGLEKIASSGLRMASNRETVVADLQAVLDETRIVIEPALREAGIALAWDVDSGLPMVQADHHSLLQAFLNLVRNSQQALENCARREMRISAAVERDLVVVRFRDTGPGVARPDELFRPFQPGANSYGLGLYISRAILRSHGGGLRYESPASGSCFAVELWPVDDSVTG